MIVEKNILMFYLSAITIFTVLIHSCSCSELVASANSDYNVTNHFLSKSLKLGVATSASQIEGAWNQSGKSPSFMDNYFFEYNDYIVDHSTTEILADSYKKYLEDIELLKYLKVDVYRFSIPWTRILPSGFTDYINWEAVEHYNNLIDALLEAGIEPLVTMLHFDQPQIFSDLGGWHQPKLIDYFTDYADLLFSLFGDRVKNWITINEPLLYCVIFPNGILKGVKNNTAFGFTEYFCAHNLLRAHGKVYRLYEKKYKKIQKGRLSLANIALISPSNSTTAGRNKKVIERANNFLIDLYLHPLIKGDYPQIVKDAVAKKSREQGFKESRLPEFTAEEIEEMKGTLDFVSVQFYGSTVLLGKNYSNDPIPSVADDIGSSFMSDNSGIQVDNYRNLLRYVRDRYDNPEICISETGTPEASLQDTFRTTYIQVLLSESLKAIKEDNINITGFNIWSLMDTIEFGSGLTSKMGLYQVDFNDPNRTRTPRLSADYFRKVSETRCLLDGCV